MPKQTKNKSKKIGRLGKNKQLSSSRLKKHVDIEGVEYRENFIWCWNNGFSLSKSPYLYMISVDPRNDYWKRLNITYGMLPSNGRLIFIET
jgi:hypothetical protein